MGLLTRTQTVLMSDIPSQMLAWRLTGAGTGTTRRRRAAVLHARAAVRRRPGAHEGRSHRSVLLGRQLIRPVPRIRASWLRTWAAEPVIPGHEAVLTVVGVGRNMRHRFEPGQRFIIQADIYYKGANIAYGYAIDGGMAQYSVMTDPILNGDEGCYLLPISDKLSAAEAALIEPWTCVIASYRIEFRSGLKPGGLLRLVGDGVPSTHTLEGLLKVDTLPARIVHTGVAGPLREELENAAARFGIPILEAESNECADDLIVVGRHAPFVLEVLATQIERKGVFCLAGDYDQCDVSVDVGRIHYHYWRYVGTRSNRIVDAYTSNTRNTLRDGE